MYGERVYIQNPGKAHAARPGRPVENVGLNCWRVRTFCGQQFEEAYQSFFGYHRGGNLCRHCFPAEEYEW